MSSEALKLTRPTYHQSELKTFLMCGKRWEFRYVHKIKMPSRSAATIGSSVDAAVSVNLSQKVTSKSDLPIDAVLSACSDDFEKRKTETEWTEEEKPGDAKDAAISVLRVHHAVVAPKISPVTVQEEFVIETDGEFDLAGAIDFTDESGVIGDTKTASRQRASSYVVERSFQPAMYDFAYRALKGAAPTAFRFDVITRPTKLLAPEYKPVQGQVTEQDHQWFFSAITETHKAIKAGVALPAPEGSWYCSQKWCEYWNVCKGRK